VNTNPVAVFTLSSVFECAQITFIASRLILLFTVVVIVVVIVAAAAAAFFIYGHLAFSVTTPSLEEVVWFYFTLALRNGTE
jgi:hypothetical protein